jgi:hypothetical protein
MNYTETFNDFATKVTTLDLALYAGVGLILWVLFKDRMSPVQKFLSDLTNNLKSKTGLDNLPSVPVPSKVVDSKKEDVFFKLVASWKQTRDLAVQNDCQEAVKVADQMFPFLSPSICQTQTKKE